MQDIGLNFDDITSNSLNNLSDLSDFSFSSVQEPQAGGGLRDFLFGNSKIDNAILEAAREKNTAVVEFMIRKNLSSYKAQDKDGNTLLHYLVSNPDPNTELIDKVLHSSDVKSFINKQNKDGDTPLIAAVKSGHHDLCTTLEKHGANKKIKNKQGHFVDTETEEQIDAKQSEGSIFQATIGPLSPSKFGTLASPKEVEAILEPIKRLLFRSKQQDTNTSEPASIMITDMTLSKDASTDDFVKQKTADLNHMPNETEDLIRKIDNHSKMSGGGDITTEGLVTDIENYFRKHTGGSSRVSGTRKVQKYSEFDMDSSEAPQKSRQSDLGQLINNQTTEIIERSLKHIKTIIADNKKDFKSIKPDDDTARAVKSILWKAIRENNPDIKSSLDVAVEMEKKINKDELMNISAKQIKEMIDVLNKVQKEKQERKPINDTTSTESVPSESNLSQTSF